MSDAAILIVGVLLVAVVVLLLLAFRHPESFREFLLGITKFELGLGGLRFERAVREAERAVVEKEGRSVTREVISAQVRRLPRDGAILWVDDHPANNAHEVEVFRNLGLRVDSVISNEAAQRALQGAAYDLVISDIGRDSEDPRAGLGVPALVKASPSADTPVLFYVGTPEAGVTSEGYVVASRPLELFAHVERLLGAQTAV